MMKIRGMTYVAGLAAGCALTTFAWAAAPEALDNSHDSVKGATVIAGTDPYKLETEMTVRNWVLCVSQDGAESLVKAHQAGPEQAKATYASLAAGKACGAFPELRVILEQPVYQPAPSDHYQGRIFDALIKFSDQWAKGYVVSDGD
jgi:hypothetical protein